MTTIQHSAPWRNKIEHFVNLPVVQHTLVVLIVLNAAILGIETNLDVMRDWGHELFLLDHAILAVFIVELVLLIMARGLSFFKDPWSVFDFVVVSIALIPSSGSLSVLRGLRVLRVLRLINKIESMRKVVSGLLKSLPGLGSVFGLIILIFYVSSVIATNMFRHDFPDWFGTLSKSAFSLFQVMTLESWSEGIARPVMAVYPFAWIFFICFILIATFIIVNLFIAVIVDSIASENSKDDLQQPQSQDIAAELKSVREELKALRALIANNSKG